TPSGKALTIAAGLLVIAALGGFAVVSFHLRKRVPPRALAAVHAIVAVAGFLCVVAAALGLGWDRGAASHPPDVSACSGRLSDADAALRRPGDRASTAGALAGGRPDRGVWRRGRPARRDGGSDGPGAGPGEGGSARAGAREPHGLCARAGGVRLVRPRRQ